MDFLYQKYFFTLKKESIKNAKIHTVICFIPSKLSSVNSSQKSIAPNSVINEIFMTWNSKPPPGSCSLESETVWSETHF